MLAMRIPLFFLCEKAAQGNVLAHMLLQIIYASAQSGVEAEASYEGSCVVINFLS